MQIFTAQLFFSMAETQLRWGEEDFISNMCADHFW